MTAKRFQTSIFVDRELRLSENIMEFGRSNRQIASIKLKGSFEMLCIFNTNKLFVCFAFKCYDAKL